MAKDLKIDMLGISFAGSPEVIKGNYNSIWFNMYGISEVDIRILNFMSSVCMKNRDSKKLIINADEKIKEELLFFLNSHKARFVK